MKNSPLWREKLIPAVSRTKFRQFRQSTFLTAACAAFFLFSFLCICSCGGKGRRPLSLGTAPRFRPRPAGAAHLISSVREPALTLTQAE